MIWLLVVVTLDKSGVVWPPIEIVGKYHLEKNCRIESNLKIEKQGKDGDKFYFCLPLSQSSRFDDY
jgi:hypothetical protein